MAGISANTVNRLVLGAGTATVGAADIGATLGGAEFWCEPTFVAPKLDGARGPVKGAVWVTQLIPKLKLRLTEMQLAKVQWVYAGSSLASDATSEVLTHTPGLIASGSYKDVVLTAAKSDGRAVTVTVNDALVLDSVTLAFTDDGIQIYEATFTGHYDPSTPTTAPYSIVNTIAG